MAGWHVAQGEPGDPKGRRVIADRSFQPGDVVLREAPYACVLYDDSLASRCDCCLEPAVESLLRCSGCKLACYRSREHQLRAWRAGHKEECAALKQLLPRVPPPTVRLAARATLQHHRETTAAGGSGASSGGSGKSGGAGAGPVTPGSAAGAAGAAGGGGDRYGEVLSLQHHWEELPDRLKVQYAQMGALAWQLVRLASPAAAQELTPRHLALLVARFACNNHTICDEELRPVGVGIYPLVSMVNHSCRPNCMQSFQGSTLVLRAVRPITPGEEVTITYVELAAPRWERRASLLSQYYFDIDWGREGLAAGGPAAQQAQQEGVLQGGSNRGRDSGGLMAGGGAAVATVGAEHVAGGGGGEEPGSALVSEVPLSDSLQLRLYSGASPPWRHDERDVDLTAVHWAGAAADGRAAGGIWGEVLPPGHEPSDASPASQLGAAGGAAAGWGDAEESFSLDAAASGEGGWSEVAASGPSSGRGVGPAGPAGGQIIVHCWLRIVEEGLAADTGPALQAAAALAGAYAQALRQLGAAEQLLGAAGAAAPGQLAVATGGSVPAGATQAGSAAAALQLAQQALAGVCGGGSLAVSSSSGGSEGTAAAVAQSRPTRRKPPAASPLAQAQHPGGSGIRCSSSGGALALGPRHLLRLRLLATALRAAVAEGDSWAAALGCAEELLPLYELVYPENWPNLGLHLATLAKLAHLVGGRAQQAQRAAQQALAILGRTHGGGSGGAAEEIRRVLFESSQEMAVGERFG